MFERVVLRHRDLAVRVDLDREDHRAIGRTIATGDITVGFHIQVDHVAIGGAQTRVDPPHNGQRYRCARPFIVRAHIGGRVDQINTRHRPNRRAVTHIERIDIAQADVIRRGIAVIHINTQRLVQHYTGIRHHADRYAWAVIIETEVAGITDAAFLFLALKCAVAN